jgi:pyruvate dehydrogenase E1 component beta subunit
MIFGEAINKAILKNLSISKKFLLMGLGVSYDNKEFYSKYPEQVIETPVSELSFTGMAVGLASQGYKPMIDHGRVEFSILALDQILTQAARWEFMFGGNYKCPACFKICIGRQWGNGPQHTGTYHSVFMQSLGMDIFIPSTPYEGYIHVLHTLKNNNPSVILEHRWLYLNNQNFKIKNNYKIHKALLVGNKKKILIITYGDGFVESLKAKKILKENGIEVSVMSLSYFPKNERISKKIINAISNYEKIYYVDTSPYDFGLLSGLSGIINTSKKYKKKPEFILASPFNPCPTSTKLTKNYYQNSYSISKAIYKMEKNKKLIIKPLTFEQIHTVTKVEIDELLINQQFIF